MLALGWCCWRRGEGPPGGFPHLKEVLASPKARSRCWASGWRGAEAEAGPLKRQDEAGLAGWKTSWLLRRPDQ